MMEASPKPGKFPLRKVHETGLLGCFMTPRRKCQAPSSPNSPGSPSSSKENFFSSDEPDLADPLFTTAKSTCFGNITRNKQPSRISEADATESESFVFSPLTFPSEAVLESPSFRTLSDPLLSTFSYSSCSVIATKLSPNYCGRPMPLPPQPVWLPLPAPEDAACELHFHSGAFVSTSDESEVGSWSIRRGKGGLTAVVGLPLPPPSIATKLLPGLESFEFEDLREGTREFAPESCMEEGAFGAVYRAWVKKPGREMAVVRLNANENQTLKDWKSDVQMLAQLPDSNICLVKGYCAHEDVDVRSVKVTSERLLVFELSPNGNLHDYLCGSRSQTPLDWSNRIGIVLGAARGLMYLHDRAPLQIVYREFKGSSVLLDKDYTPRLAGYGLVVMSSLPDRKSSLASVMKTSQAHAKSNVWSFGIVLLELLTGKSSLDGAFLGDEKNFVRWAEPFLRDESKLAQILDPRLKSFQCRPTRTGARKVADLASQCLKKKELQRPSMSRVVDVLKSIKGEYLLRSTQPVLQPQHQPQPHHHYSQASKAPSFQLQSAGQHRRATFGGLSFRDLEERSKAWDRQFLSLDRRRSSVSTSSDLDTDTDRSWSHHRFCTCVLQSGKAGESAKASSCRVF